jgi:XRE family aerobic/anaerobic benzoate catabolism transcriptional regulator
VTTIDILSEVGARIRRLRREKGWSRRELAQRCGLSERFLAQVEAGRGNPSLRSFSEIARAFETSPASLLTARSEIIALLGLRGAGKSTVGKLLGERLGVPFVELDALIEQAAGLSLGEIWQLHGEPAFRQYEREALQQFLATTSRAVLATTGGIVTDPITYELLRQSTVTVWLKARPEDHWNRVVAQGDRRPMEGDPRAMERLTSLLAERTPAYQMAKHVLQTSSRPVEVVAGSAEQLVKG